MRRMLATLALGVALAAAAAPAQGAFVSFRSPSGNIGCVGSNAGGSDNYVRCDARNHTWAPPARPASCTLDWGLGFDLGRRGMAHWVCAGDTALGGTTVLRYGTAIRIGNLVCRSRRTGITCRNLRGWAFTISRTVATRFRVPPAP